MKWTRVAKHFYDFGKRHAGIATAGTVTVIGILVYQRSREESILAAWTTNFEPSVKWDDNWDRRNPPECEEKREFTSEKEKKDFQNECKKNKPTASRHLILIRHGQYNLDAESAADKRLTELGKEQANYTGLRLKELDLPYTAMVSSTMIRAIETAEIIKKHLPDIPWTQTDLLREGFPIIPEPPLTRWKPDKNSYADGKRIEAAFREHFHRADPSQEKDSFEILVCHANVIRYFFCRALQLPPEAWLRIGLNHASITYLTIRPSGRVSLRTLGNDGHIPYKKSTVF